MTKKPTYEELEQRVKAAENESLKRKRSYERLRLLSLSIETEHKQAEEALRDSRYMLKTVLDSVPSGIFWKDRDSIYLGANRTWLKAIGLKSSEEVVGKNDYNLPWKKKQADSFREDDRRIIESGIPEYDIIETYRLADGTLAWAKTNKVPLRDREGNIIGVLGTYEDITDRKRNEEALRKSEEQKKAILNASIDRIRLVDKDMRIIWANKTTARELKRTPEALVGEFCYKAFVGRDAPCPECPTKKALKSGKIEHAFIHQTKSRGINGETYWDSYTIPVKNETGDIENFIQSSRNITEAKQAEEALRESEEKHRLLFESTGDAIFIHDAEARMLAVNSLACERLGYTHAELMSMRINQVDSPAEGHHAPDRIARLFSQGHLSFETVHQCKDGSHIPTEVSAWKIIWDGQPAIMSICRDITERERAKEEKAKLEAHLQQAQKMEAIGTLAGGIAHDFNNILAAVIGLSELSLLETVEDSSLHRHIERILEAGMRAKGLVRQILAFSRQRDQAFIPMSISPVIREALKLIRSSLPSSIEIRQYIENVPELIEGDPTQIHQVVMNLCTNAEHAMREKGGVLDIKMGRVDVDEEMATLAHNLHPGSYIRLQVTDTGYGIEPETMERIFDPYFTTKGVGKGTGLGLAVVQGIVHKHGGAVHVESEPGKRTTFQVFFPVIEGEKKEIKEKREAPLPTGTERILFIDDEAVLAETGKEILERLGYKVTIRTSSTEALELFKAKPGYFDLVITDMSMPNMTGEQLSREVMKIRPELPIILCTGFSHIISEEKALEIGIQGFAMKPLSIKDLAEIVRRVLDQKNATFESR